MPRFVKDIVAAVVYLLFGAIEIVVLFGGFLVALGIPYLVAKSLGAKSGDSISTTAISIGVIFVLLWYFFLDKGGRKKIEQWFRITTHKAIRSLGAGDAIED